MNEHTESDTARACPVPGALDPPPRATAPTAFNETAPESTASGTLGWEVAERESHPIGESSSRRKSATLSGWSLMNLDARHMQWRRECLPLLYDWFLCWPMVWVLGGVQWGPRLQVLRAFLADDPGTGTAGPLIAANATETTDSSELPRTKRRSAKSFGIRLEPISRLDQSTFERQELYFSERTGPTVPDAPSEPNTLLVAECCIARENFMRASDIGNAWNTDLYSSCGSGSGAHDVPLAERAASARRAREHREHTLRCRLEELEEQARAAKDALVAAGIHTNHSSEDVSGSMVSSNGGVCAQARAVLEAFAELLRLPECERLVRSTSEQVYQELYDAVIGKCASENALQASVTSGYSLEALRTRRAQQSRFHNPMLPFHTRVPHGISIAVPIANMRRKGVLPSTMPSPELNEGHRGPETESLSSQSGPLRDSVRLDYDEYLGEVINLTPEEFDDNNVPVGSRRDGLSGMGGIYVVNEDGSSGCWARDSSAFTGGIVVRRRRRANASNAFGAAASAAGAAAATEEHSQHAQDNGVRVFYDEFRVRKRLIHPGEVNRIRYLGMTFDPNVNHEGCFPADALEDDVESEPVQTTQCARWIVTHTDAPELMVWNVNEQVHRPDNDKLRPNVPDLVLVGHTSEAPYAIDTTFGGDVFPDAFLVASGGSDHQVLVWRLTSDLLLESREQKRATVTDTIDDLSGSLHPVRHAARYTMNVAPTHRLFGHSATVEDVCFHPINPSLLASCGDDGCLLLWDLRAPPRPIGGVRRAHAGDVNCLDWSRDRNARYMITGGEDGVVRLWDTRAMSSWAIEGTLHRKSQPAEPLYEFMADDRFGGAVSCVQWNPLDPRYFLSAAETEVIVWDTETMDILFRHAGHRTRIQEAYWNPYIPWVIMTTSEAGESEADGTPSMVSLWRVLDLVHMHDAQVAAEFDVWQNTVAQSV